jgi:hypothetical protein
MAHDFLANREALDQFIAEWEAGVLPKVRWTHAAHIVVGTYYAVCYPESALEKTRKGIVRYNEAVGTANTDTSGYHETLTCFWAALLARDVQGIADPLEAVRRTVERYGEARKLHERSYSFDVVKSVEARRKWIPPDVG